MDNVELLRETLDVIESGCYFIGDKVKMIRLDTVHMEAAQVLTENDVRQIRESVSEAAEGKPGRCAIQVENTDSYEAARKLAAEAGRQTKKPVLVLNFANPVHPGGGVRRGARAQEEDLCRKSTLLASLEGINARPYYQQHRARRNYLATDAMILSPEVEIFRDGKAEFLKKTEIVSVLTCAAPMASRVKYEVSDSALEEILYQRICGILAVAQYYGYQYLVLGAWGCGAFGNDAGVVARLFWKALDQECTVHGEKRKIKEMFKKIVFAVLDRTQDLYNYNCFAGRFKGESEMELYEKELNQRMEKNQKYQDKFRGCLVGGAVGDALGTPIEFWTANEIFRKYGEKGLTEYAPDYESGLAVISDDTQMTMFTACGILYGNTRRASKKPAGTDESYIYRAYLDWLHTQEKRSKKAGISWILREPDLYCRRAPGMTCLGALRSGQMGSVAEPINSSKGCGGVMRVAPVGLYYGREAEDIDDVMRLGAEAAAITHGHSLGYMSAAALVHIVNRAVYGTCSFGDNLYDIVEECIEALSRIYADDPYLDQMIRILDKAVELSQCDDTDVANIHEIGGGWVGEEALAIALYCCLKYQDDFSKAIIASVNHSGDGDSTGAIAGNIMGALIGYEAIPDKWKQGLELQKTILELADDLCSDCLVSEDGAYVDPEWERKYVECK